MGSGSRGSSRPISELLVDGKEVSIDYFTEVRGGEAITAAPSEAGPQGIPSVSAGSTVGTSYLVFIDDFFSIQRDRNLVLRSLSEQAAGLGVNDRMAIVAYNGKRLEMLTTWSQSVPALERAFRTAMDRPAFGLHRLTEQRIALRDVQMSRATGGMDRSTLGRVDLPVRDYVEQLAEYVENSVDAASSTLRGFAAPPGRKVMLLLSGGWPIVPAQTVMGPGQLALPEHDIPGGPELFEPLSDTANQLGYTLYPVDVPGLQGEGDIAVDSTVLERDFTSGTAIDREQEVQASLYFLASETGGKALVNSRRSDVFGAVSTDTRLLLLAGFQPQPQGRRQAPQRRGRGPAPGPASSIPRELRRRVAAHRTQQHRRELADVRQPAEYATAPGRRRQADQGGAGPASAAHRPDSGRRGHPRAGRGEAGGRTRAADRGARRTRPAIGRFGDPDPLQRRQAIDKGRREPFVTAIDVRKVQQSVVVALVDMASGEMFSTTVTLSP